MIIIKEFWVQRYLDRIKDVSINTINIPDPPREDVEIISYWWEGAESANIN